MKFNQIVNNYIEKLKKEHSTGLSSGQFTAELSYRNSLHYFFEEVASQINSNIRIISEPKNQNHAGRPDWRFHDDKTMGVYGFIEAKGISLDSKIDINQYHKQIKKYLSLGHKVILTDGIEFVLFHADTTTIEVCSLIKKPFKNFDNIEIDYSAESFFRKFFEEIGYRYITEEQLIEEVARRTKALASNIEEVVGYDPEWADDEVEKKTIKSLLSLKKILEGQHDQALHSEKLFADFIAQILTFGLLYAHRIIRNDERDPHQIYENIYKIWADIIEYSEYTEELYPFKALISLLDNELNNTLSEIGLWYDDTRRLLSYIKLTNTQREMPNYHVLYEKFLSIYDPNTRFELGSFYTPTILASYAVNLVSTVINTYMSSSLPFDISTKVIDPACGTGAFLEELIKKYPINMSPTTIGFEIHPVPYALAHYRMAMFSKNKNLHIVLTNTLSDALEDEIIIPSSDLLVMEQNKAKTLSKPPLTIIIGNPPSSDSKSNFSNSGNIINILLNDFRPPEDNRTSRQNIQKQVQNEFVKFTRWACNKLFLSKPGILCFILPSSFADRISYKYARKWMIEHFQSIWVLEFDSDNRSNAKAENIFDTLQGRILLAGIMTDSNTSCELHYKSIMHLNKKNKLEFLAKFESDDKLLNEFEKMKINHDTYSFSPKNSSLKTELYSSFFDLCEKLDDGSESQFIFSRHCSGIKFAPTHLFVHVEEGQLYKRTKDIAKKENSYEDIKTKWYTGIAKPPREAKISTDIKILLEKAIKAKSARSYAYRPFLTTSALLNKELLSSLAKMDGGGTRYRPEVISAFDMDKTFGISITPGVKEVSQNLHRFASFGWHVPDNDLSRRGSAHIFCNYFPEYKSKSWNSTPIGNINPALLDELASAFNKEKSDLIDMIVYYVYAILCSKYYLGEFESELFEVAGNWPKIPLIKEQDVFNAIFELGKRLANIEKEDYISKNGIFTNSNKDLHKEDFELKSYSYDTEKKCVSMISTNNLNMIEIQGIPEYLITFEISGYSVVGEWVKMHCFNYLRKDFNKIHFFSLLNLFDKIQEQESTIQEIDIILQSIF